MDPRDASSLEYWRSYGDWGFKLVIIGVAGEVLVAIINKCFNKLFKKWENRWELFAMISGVVLVVGLAMEYRGHKREMLIVDKDNLRLNKELKQAVKDAGESIKQAGLANDRAGISKLAAAKANERAQELEMTRVEIDKQVAPRRLSPMQEWKLAERLTQSSGSVIVVSTVHDEETSDLADDFDDVLRYAHWQASRIVLELLKTGFRN
jgi:hypothetical protein